MVPFNASNTSLLLKDFNARRRTRGMLTRLLGLPVSSLCICTSIQKNASESIFSTLTEQMNILTEKEPYGANLKPF